MARARVTVLWAGSSGDAVPHSLARDDVELVRVESSALVPKALPALARGAVVAVVPDAAAAQHALGMGIDEVVYAGESNPSAVTHAIERAQVRAAARVRRERLLSDAAHREDVEPLLLITTALAHEMNNPLAVASLNCEVLRLAMDAIAKLCEELTSRAQRGEGLERDELVRLIAQLDNAPSPDDIESTLEDLEDALQMAGTVVARMSALATLEEPEEITDLSELVPELEALVRHEVERVAKFTVDIPDERCTVRIPRAWAIQVIASMLSNSSKAVAESRRSDGEIELHLVLSEDTALIEVLDNGVGMSAAVRTRALDPFFTTRRPGSLGLGLTMAAGYVQRMGGDILIESEEGEGAAVRVFLPLADGRASTSRRVVH